MTHLQWDWPKPHGLHSQSLLIVGGNAGVQARPEHFRLLPCLAENVIGFCLLRGPFGGAFRSVTQPWPQSILFGQEGTSYSRSLESLAVVPRHPRRRVGRQFPGVPLQFGQVVERVGAAQLRGVNQTHEQVADLRAVQGPIE